MIVAPLIAAFGDAEPRTPVEDFRAVFEAVSRGAAGAGVVPIENLVNGSVREVYEKLGLNGARSRTTLWRLLQGAMTKSCGR